MPIFIVLLFLSLATLICTYLYSSNSLKQRTFFGVIPLSQIVTSIVPTTLFITCFISSYLFILQKNVPTLWDNLILIVIVLACSFGALGVGIHFTGKCLSTFLDKKRHRKLSKTNHLFHIVLGHHITFVLGMIGLLSISILNFLHPSTAESSLLEIALIIIVGFLWALSWAFTFIYAPITRIPYIILGWLSSAIIIALFVASPLPLSLFPFSIFYFSTILSISILVTLVWILEKLHSSHIFKVFFKESSLKKIGLPSFRNFS